MSYFSQPGTNAKGHLRHVCGPDLLEYERWLESVKSADPRGKWKWTANKLRRAVAMKRRGCTLKEIGESVGLSFYAVSDVLKRLPESLR